MGEADSVFGRTNVFGRLSPPILGWVQGYVLFLLAEVRSVRADLDLYNRQDWDHSMCIPIAYHGDEGRGKLKRPILILDFQPLISFKGMEYINSSGNPDCTLI